MWFHTVCYRAPIFWGHPLLEEQFHTKRTYLHTPSYAASHPRTTQFGHKANIRCKVLWYVGSTFEASRRCQYLRLLRRTIGWQWTICEEHTGSGLIQSTIPIFFLATQWNNEETEPVYPVFRVVIRTPAPTVFKPETLSRDRTPRRKQTLMV